MVTHLPQQASVTIIHCQLEVMLLVQSITACKINWWHAVGVQCSSAARCTVASSPEATEDKTLLPAGCCPLTVDSWVTVAASSPPTLDTTAREWAIYHRFSGPRKKKSFASGRLSTRGEQHWLQQVLVSPVVCRHDDKLVGTSNSAAVSGCLVAIWRRAGPPPLAKGAAQLHRRGKTMLPTQSVQCSG